MRRITTLLLALIAALGLAAPAAAEKVVTLTFAGDCTLGTEEATRRNVDSFDSYVRKKGYGYFFENFRDLFSGDDCTVVNCEGVLSDSSDWEVKSKAFRFRGPEEFVNILTEASVEAVSLANNHTNDYSGQGLENTKRVLEEAGVGWAWDEYFYIFEKDGIRIAFASIDYGIFQQSICRMSPERPRGLREMMILQPASSMRPWIIASEAEASSRSTLCPERRTPQKREGQLWQG